MADEKPQLQILYCPEHKFYAVGVASLRVTPSKCCGSWTILKSWPVTKSVRGYIRDALSHQEDSTNDEG